MEIKCKNCVYYTGMECQEHGEYFGECNAIKILKKIIALNNNISKYNIKLKGKNIIDDIDIRTDENTCLLFEIEND